LKFSLIRGSHCGAAEGPAPAPRAQRASVSKNKKEKDVKLNSRKLSIACLAAFALLFAVATPAQSLHGPRKGPARAANANATAAAKAKVKSDAVHGDATEACTYQFTSGSADTYLQFCVTVNGNIVQFQAPAGVEQIDQGGSYEGYGICDQTTEATYYDYAYTDSGNWNAPTTVSHTGTLVKIERTTNDGAWTLTQTITSSPGPNPVAKIAMALKNNSGESKEAYLLRYANVNAGDAATIDNYAENYDGGLESAWGYTSFEAEEVDAPYGLLIQNVGNSAPTTAEIFREGYAISGFDGPTPCNPFAGYTGTLYNEVGSVAYLYDLTFKKEQTVTVTSRYMSF
jgi:hypothetical protein